MEYHVSSKQKKKKLNASSTIITAIVMHEGYYNANIIIFNVHVYTHVYKDIKKN